MPQQRAHQEQAYRGRNDSRQTHGSKPLKLPHKTAFKTPPPIVPQYGLHKSAKYPKSPGFYSPLLGVLIIPQTLLPIKNAFKPQF